jgi:hypothetical protein
MMVGASSQLGLEDRPEARAVVHPVAEIRITGFRKLLIIKTEVVRKPARQTFWGWVRRLAQTLQCCTVVFGHRKQRQCDSRLRPSDDSLVCERVREV